MSSKKYKAFKELLKAQRLPLAILDMDQLEKNIQLIQESVGIKNIRIATKSIRCTRVLRKILDSSPIFNGLMCYTLEEALWLASKGFDDLLVAYPTYNREQITNLCRRFDDGTRITLMIDCLEHLEYLEEIAQSEQAKLRICIDQDLSTQPLGFIYFGVRRSPLKKPKQVKELIKFIQQSEHLNLVGLMGYEAQVAGVGDHQFKGLKGWLVRLFKKWAEKKAITKRLKMFNFIKKLGSSLEFINGGGTGSLKSTQQDNCVTEITVGSGFFTPTLFDLYDSLRTSPSLFFALEVVRIPHKRYITCLGGGYIASGAIHKQKAPSPWLPKGLKLDPNEMAGEVQTPLKLPKNIELKIGDPVIFRHAKAGELCEHFSSLLVIKQDQIQDQYLTYRGEGKHFL